LETDASTTATNSSTPDVISDASRHRRCDARRLAIRFRLFGSAKFPAIAGAVDYCYLPHYVFCGRHLLAAKLRRANIDGSAGAEAEVERIVGPIRERWRKVRIVLRANQPRLWLASMAYVLLCALRRIGLAHTRFAAASCGSIRLALLRIGALITVSCRRIKLAMASGCPYQDDFRQARVLLAAALTKQTAHSSPFQPAIADHSARSRRPPGQAQRRRRRQRDHRNMTSRLSSHRPV